MSDEERKFSEDEKALNEYDAIHFIEAYTSKGFVIQKAYKLQDDKWIEIGDGFTYYER